MPQVSSDEHERFLTLFTMHEPAIRAFVRRLVPSRQDAADVMQGVALVLWRKFRDLDDLCQFRPWAFGVARYEALAWIRDGSRNRLVLSSEVLETVAHESARWEDRLSSQRDALEQCLEKLPHDQRSLLLAAYTPESQIHAVAEQSGRSIGAFYQWLHRMRLRLLECTRRTLQAEVLS